jgi:hypothetical protein
MPPVLRSVPTWLSPVAYFKMCNDCSGNLARCVFGSVLIPNIDSYYTVFDPVNCKSIVITCHLCPSYRVIIREEYIKGRKYSKFCHRCMACRSRKLWKGNNRHLLYNLIEITVIFNWYEVKTTQLTAIAPLHSCNNITPKMTAIAAETWWEFSE